MHCYIFSLYWIINWSYWIHVFSLELEIWNNALTGYSINQSGAQNEILRDTAKNLEGFSKVALTPNSANGNISFPRLTLKKLYPLNYWPPSSQCSVHMTHQLIFDWKEFGNSLSELTDEGYIETCLQKDFKKLFGVWKFICLIYLLFPD